MKKFIAVLFVVALTFVMFACSATPAASSAAPASSAAASVAAASSAAPASSAAAATSAKAAGKLIKIGFAQVGHESDWRTASTNSVQAAFTKDKGFDLSFVDCNNDSAAQLTAVRQFIQDQVDYIVIDPIVSTGWDTVLTEAQTAKIPVIVIDRTIDDSTKYAAWVGSQFTNEGLAAGAWLKAYAALKKITTLNILVIEGTTGSSAQIGRTNGFKQYATDNKWNILDSQTGNFTQDGGQKVMESYAKSYAGKFNVVVAQNDNEAFGAMDAMDAAGVSYGVGKPVTLISFDASKAGLKDVHDQKINSDFMCYPLQGTYCADIITKLAAGQTVAQKTFMTEPWYAAENVIPTITYTNADSKSVTEKMVYVDDATLAAAPY
jgi:simple sugar transport system substrate-binding protein